MSTSRPEAATRRSCCATMTRVHRPHTRAQHALVGRSRLHRCPLLGSEKAHPRQHRRRQHEEQPSRRLRPRACRWQNIASTPAGRRPTDHAHQFLAPHPTHKASGPVAGMKSDLLTPHRYDLRPGIIAPSFTPGAGKRECFDTWKNVFTQARHGERAPRHREPSAPGHRHRSPDRICSTPRGNAWPRR